jgi:hypothetical protein
LDALNLNPLIGPVGGMGGGACDFLEDLVTFDQFAKCGVFPIQKAGGTVTDKKLAASGIRVFRARHGNHTAIMMPIVELSFDLVPRVPGAPTGFIGGIFGERIASLNHEVSDHPMEASPVVEPFSSECFEILDRLGSDIWPKFHDHLSMRGSNAGNFVIHQFNVPTSLGFVTRRIVGRNQNGARLCRPRPVADANETSFVSIAKESPTDSRNLIVLHPLGKTD